MSSRQRFGGMNTSPAASRGRNAPRDTLFLVPSGSLFKSSEIPQAPINKFKLFERALLVLLTSAAVLVATFIALFVHT